MKIIDSIKNFRVLFAVVIVIFGVVFREKIESLCSNFLLIGNRHSNISVVLSPEQLEKFNGIDEEKLYLAVLGSVYDVSQGNKHYAKGATYNYFIGKDGSRSFVTGNFKEESKDKDHVLDLTCDELLSLLHWKDTFDNKYKYVGVLIGRYYDKNGEKTAYSKELQIKIEQCRLEKENVKKEEFKYPPCNAAWDVEEGTKVWCTKTSGGISRSWVGVPRQLYSPGIERPRCACINLGDDNSGALLKAYDNCPLTSTSCNIGSS